MSDSNMRLEFLEQKVTVIAQEMSSLVREIHSSIGLMAQGTRTALNSLDARLSELESAFNGDGGAEAEYEQEQLKPSNGVEL